MTAAAILSFCATKTLTKHCPCCKSNLQVSAFHKNRRSKDGLQGFCIACSKTYRNKPDKERAEKTRALKSFVYQSGSKPCSECLVCKPLTLEHWTLEDRGLGGYSSKCKDCRKKARDDKKSPDLISKQNDASDLYAAGMKRCPCCKEAKEFSFFMTRKIGGYYSYCLDCSKSKSSEQRLTDLNKDREKKLRSWKKRYLENGIAMREYRNNNRRERLKVDPVFAMECRVRGHLNTSIKRLGYTKRSRTHEILGCNWEFFKAHIERQFIKGMNWQNRNEWHIDHIVPIASAQTEEDVMRLNHFTNLRPLWAKDNLSKSDKLTHLI